MFVNAENIHNIVIASTEHAVDFEQFKKFIQKSPFVRRVAFIGKAIFDLPEFPEMVKFCAVNNIYLIFGEVGETLTANLRALVEYKNVILINIHEDKHNVKLLNQYKQEFNSDLPKINIIVPANHAPQDEISATSYAFYNLADDITDIACLNLLQEPMLDYNGELLGCWQNPDKKHPVNAFDLGMEKAFSSAPIKKMLTMLKTGKICKSCPCTRCPVFASLVWTDQKIDICKRVFNND
jgi:hypothetical protein